MKNCIFYILLISSTIACTTDQILTIEQRRAIDADFNDKITPGVKNVLYEKEFIANSESQLVFKMGYNKDTLAAYGKIDNTGKVEYIHTTVVMKEGGKNLFVYEIFPDISVSRMYSIVNNIKSSLVIEIKYISKTRYTISLLDFDWNTGTSKVLSTNMISDGDKIAEFSTLRSATSDRIWNCDQPQPAEDLDGVLNNQLDFFACGGLAWETHPTLKAVKETITSIATTINSSEKNADKAEQISFLEKEFSSLSSLIASLDGKIGYKFEKTLLTGLLKELEKSIAKLKEDQYTILLAPFKAATDLEYDEVEDNEIKITFTVTDTDTGLPFTNKPVFVDIAFMEPGTNKAFDIQTKATSEVNGMVTFKFDPTSIEGYEKYSQLIARWDLSSNDWQKALDLVVSLKFIKPKVVFKDGSPLPSSIGFNNQQTQLFKLVNEDDRAIAADYSLVTINNLTNSKIGYTLLKGSDDFSLTLYTNETTSQTTNFDVYYKSKKIQTQSAQVMDSLEIYRVSALGSYTVNAPPNVGNGPNSKLYCELKEGGIATYTIYDDPSWPNGYSWNIGWVVRKGNDNYYILTGWTNPGYQAAAAQPLKYPVTSFVYSNTYTK